MPYIIAYIISAVTAITLLLTRYDANDASIDSQLEKMQTMFLMIDGFVNTYVQVGGVLDEINFEELKTNGILLEESRVENSSFSSILTLPNDKTKWQIIPNKDNFNSYKLLVDFTADSALMDRAIFSESFISKEYCEKMLFGKTDLLSNSFIEEYTDGSLSNRDFQANEDASNSDGKFVCTVFR